MVEGLAIDVSATPSIEADAVERHAKLDGLPGREDAVHRGVPVRGVLAAVPCVLPLRVTQPARGLPGPHSTRVPGDVLAGHVARNVQPHRVLLHEQKVQGILSGIPVRPLLDQVGRRARAVRHHEPARPVAFPALLVSQGDAEL